MPVAVSTRGDGSEASRRVSTRPVLPLESDADEPTGSHRDEQLARSESRACRRPRRSRPSPRRRRAPTRRRCAPVRGLRKQARVCGGLRSCDRLPEGIRPALTLARAASLEQSSSVRDLVVRTIQHVSAARPPPIASRAERRRRSTACRQPAPGPGPDDRGRTRSARVLARAPMVVDRRPRCDPQDPPVEPPVVANPHGTPRSADRKVSW